MNRRRPAHGVAGARASAATVLALGWFATLMLSSCDDDPAAQITDAFSEQRRDAAELAVCRFNSDCLPGFYCKDRRCDLDCREHRDCPVEHTCQSGQCIPPMVEPPTPCTNDIACRPPNTVCESGVCVDGCIAAGCPADAQGRLQRCSASTGRCGTLDCRVDGCVPTDTLPNPLCEQSTGLCIPPPDPVEVCGEMCRDDEYCDPDLMRCVLRPARCTPQSCAANQRCDEESGQCVALPFDCRRDGCQAPQVCNQETGTCGQPAPFDCNLGDPCPQGFECVVLTGECAPEVPRTGGLGDPCDAASACQSNMCLGLGGIGFCTQPCCREDDCPPGFGCLYSSAAGGGACMPAERFPSNFTTPAGGACGAGFNDCRTGLCLGGQCQDACCTDGDCDGFTCVVLPTSADSARAICDVPNLLGGPPGSICYGDLDCYNRICLIHPDATPDNVFGFCSDTCCTHDQCTGLFGPGFGCGLTGFFDGRGQVSFTINACAPLTFGDRADGEVCATDADCQSAACMEGQCRQPCCNDRTCGNQRCLPRVNTENVLQRACVPPDPIADP